MQGDGLATRACRAVDGGYTTFPLPRLGVGGHIPSMALTPLPLRLAATRVMTTLMALFLSVLGWSLEAPSGVVALPADKAEQVPCGGAAVVVAADGLAVTLAEALPDAAAKAQAGFQFTVVLAGGLRRTATIVRRGTTTTAIALRISNLPPAIIPLGLGDSATAQVGDQVWTAGNAFGALEEDGAAAMSRGIMSGHYSIAADSPSVRGRGGRVLSTPLWSALPDGALKRQMLPELARQSQLELADLASLWGDAPPAPKPRAPQPPQRAPLRSPGRKAPAALADLAVRLLLRHSDWWQRLPSDDHGLLHELEGTHGEVVAWLEQQVTEHGDQTWATLEQAMVEQPWHETARRWVAAAHAEEEQSFEDLLRVTHRLWRGRLEQEVTALIATGQTDRATLGGVQALRARIKAHHAAERDPHAAAAGAG